jgi:hypothetical protein
LVSIVKYNNRSYVDKPFEHFLLMNYMFYTRVISLMSVKIGPVYVRTMEMTELFLVPWSKTLKYLNYFLLGFYSKV